MTAGPIFSSSSAAALRLGLCSARRGRAVELLYPVVEELGKDRVGGTECGDVWDGC